MLFDLLHGNGDFNVRFDQHAQFMKSNGLRNWPVTTLIPFLLYADEQCLLRNDPVVGFTNSFPFELDYQPEPNSGTYTRLQRLYKLVANLMETEGLKPRDNLDVQSFLWVVEKY